VVAALFGALLPASAHAAHDGGEGLFDVQSADVPVAGTITAGVSGVGYRLHRSQEPGALVDRTNGRTDRWTSI
jgi:hypothetical protein